MEFQSPTANRSERIFSSSVTRQPPPAQLPFSMRLAVAEKSGAAGKESASTKMSQSPVAAEAPRLRAREIWLIGSKITMAPASRAISEVRSVELLSQTTISQCQPRSVKALQAERIAARDLPSSFSSLKAGTTTEIFINSGWTETSPQNVAEGERISSAYAQHRFGNVGSTELVQ